MDISVDIRGGAQTWDVCAIERLALFALKHMKAPAACELSVSLVSIDEMQTLNAQYRDLDRPTDVLSFECDNPWEAPEESDEIAIGDVVIAPDIIAGQAQTFSCTFEEEASLMLVHGILHLLGYDHMVAEEAEEMEALEKEILEAYGIVGVR